MVTAQQRLFVEAQRVARLATADRQGTPHVVPVCFALAEDRLYITIDGKPKRRHGPPLKRLRNIAENPRTAIVFDRYDEDWRRLGWVMLQGWAEVLESGPEHDHAQSLLRLRYPQLAAMQIAELPVIAIHVEKVASWGDLAA
ncbi:MAG: TIGR03668 family PPOX class F420-dependent oxidoreductase [Pseudomonadota bacterium]